MLRLPAQPLPYVALEVLNDAPATQLRQKHDARRKSATSGMCSPPVLASAKRYAHRWHARLPLLLLHLQSVTKPSTKQHASKFALTGSAQAWVRGCVQSPRLPPASQNMSAAVVHRKLVDTALRSVKGISCIRTARPTKLSTSSIPSTACLVGEHGHPACRRLAPVSLQEHGK